MRKNFYKALFAGLLLLAALVFAVSHFGELTHFLFLLRNIEPFWILLALFFQIGTYIALALVWQRALSHFGVDYPLHQLLPLALAKLFADQALPSGGISGIAFIVNAFRQRNISRKLGMGVMLLSILTYYAAYVLVAAASFFILWEYHHISQWMVVVGGIFFVFAVAVPGVILLVKKRGVQKELPVWLMRLPIVVGILETYADVPDDAMRQPFLFAEATFFQIIVFLLDAATLWAMLYALGEPVTVFLAFPCFVLASIVAMLSLIPLGIGSFEATCVALLVMLGIKVETALAATLLLRGFMVYLPMIPGLLLTRRELR
ncbi:MAG: flippase-like domain-containing protein [Chlorobiaceae bacterium]|jgi:glycosyltransferase 2 family protein|nr:flippase-like domain-containing protein [Chlorobiaceae bacterium]NTV16314.1 flippase-like domain-containing protein [Chlorobiaceae bacterium]